MAEDINALLEEVALTLENDRSFYETYKRFSGKDRAGARSLIRACISKDRTLARHYDRFSGEGEGKAARESLRRYFDDRYAIMGRPGQDSDSMRGKPVPYPWGDDPTGNGKPPVPKAPTQAKAEEDLLDDLLGVGPAAVKPHLGFDYSSLPDGTTLVCVNGQTYVKGAKTSDGYPVKVVPARPVFGANERGHQDWTRCGSTNEMRSNSVIGYDLVGYIPQQPALTGAEKAQAVGDHLYHLADAMAFTIQVFNDQTPQENTMSQIITVTTKTLVNGQDISGMPKSAIYDLIAQQEAAIEKLEAIKTKPKMLVKEIAERRDGIDKLVAYLDSQDDAPAKD